VHLDLAVKPLMTRDRGAAARADDSTASRLVRGLAFALALVAALAVTPPDRAALLGADVSPAVSVTGAIQLYSLVVPAQATRTTSVSMTAPTDFAINSFVPAVGWKRRLSIVPARGRVAERVIWSGGPSPHGQALLFQFLGQPDTAGTYTFDVRQTLSRGASVTWDGPARSPTAAPTIEVRSSIGPTGRQPLLDWVALVVSVIGVIVGATALLVRGRPPE
jgi:hypothetical protein